MKNSVDLNAANRRTGERSEKDSAKSITKSLTIASFERLEDDNSVVGVFTFRIFYFGSINFNHATKPP
jgi:hypothetical protein